ncbi:hypothetical protein BLNAU_3961 [Blattamonas nauphoetae]|uniref:Uncharacterized protein n=1 Tax=Blattamonas nauphoetae TaxID=2049346 RepID=A0ABQ9YBY9_9EUKA|nr:hypothetical protein BLNAU_3961 [Blattamonas nauphoetae]
MHRVTKIVVVVVVRESKLSDGKIISWQYDFHARVYLRLDRSADLRLDFFRSESRLTRQRAGMAGVEQARNMNNMLC